MIELALLSAQDEFRVRSGEPDPHGWRVVDANSVAIGVVDDLIIDVQGLTARYIVCSIRRGTQRSVLIPVGFARLNTEQSTVHLDFVTDADVEKLPTFNALPLSDDFQAEQQSALTGVEADRVAEPKIVRRNS